MARVSTKEKILACALEMFNNEGVEQVSTRHIATKLGISDGNVRYHFRTREEIIVALYLQLVDVIGQKLVISTTGKLGVKVMYEMLAHLMHSFYAYRFLLRNLPGILRMYETIRVHFKTLTKERVIIIEIVMGQLVQNRIMKPETEPGQRRKMIENMLLSTHFWLNGSELFYEGKEKDKLEYYTDVIFSMMLPYLTETGLEEWRTIQNKLKGKG